ncbi:MAG: zinc transporter ZupT [Deltaproteobacteria bacterium]|nr:zinc transporter ZupT [Deltaproteobacteria bacterium]
MTFDGSFYTAIALTTFAGLSTTIGSAIAVFYRNPGPRYMAFTLGFSAGVMVLVSFVELLQQGISILGFTTAHAAFFLGIFLMLAIDMCLPHIYILESYGDDGGRLKRASVLVALGIAIHNFPEGMVTFAGTLKSTDMGIALAVAVAIHNIPEGIAVAVPVYAATKSAAKAFKWSALSGVSEPVGAFLAAMVFMPFLTERLLGWILCMVAGFMVFISFDELLPVAHSYRQEHVAIIGVIAGMIVMAASLAMLAG